MKTMKRIFLLAAVIFACATHLMAQYKDFECVVSCESVKSIAIDDESVLIATSKGVVCYDQRENISFVINGESGLPEDSVESVACKNGIMWIGTQSQGIVRYDGENFEVFNEDNSGLQSYKSTDCLAVDENGHLWCAGLCFIHEFDGETWNEYAYSSFAKWSMAYLNSIAIDEEGVAWVAGFRFCCVRNGVLEELSSDYKFTCVAIDGDGNKWLSSSMGLVKYDGHDFTLYSTSNSELPTDSLTCVAVDDEGNILIGSGSGLIVYDGTTFLRINLIDGGERITSIAVDGEQVWIGTSSDGLIRGRRITDGISETRDSENRDKSLDDESFYGLSGIKSMPGINREIYIKAGKKYIGR